MDPLLIICTLLGFTFEYSRRVYRTYHPRTEPARDFREFLPQRVSNWIDEVDWERDLGMRYDAWVPPEPNVIETESEIEENPKPVAAPVEKLEEASDLELAARLESEVVRAVTQTIFDEIGLIELADEPEEELLPLEKVVIVKEEFVAIDPLAGQPAGAPSVIADETRSITLTKRTIPAPLQQLHTPASASEEKLPLEEVVAARIATFDPLAGQPVGAPSVIGGETTHIPTTPVPTTDLVPMRLPITPESLVPGQFVTTALLMGQPIGDPSVFMEQTRPSSSAEPDLVAPRFAPRLAQLPEYGPVGAPGVYDHTISSPSKIMPIDFRGTPEEYRIAASARKSDDYSIAAYTLNSSDDKGPSRDAASGEENEPPLDPVDELIAELLEEEPPEEDPNTLELPLVIPAPPNPYAYCEPVGGPDAFECLLPAPIEADSEEAGMAEEPSAPTTRQVNRISERVENILSAALARPAPAVNFGDLLAQMDARQEQRKKKQQETANRLPSQALEDNIERSADRDGGLKMTEYKVQFEIFEGPLDLLLYLVRKQEVDIYEVNLTQIAEEFIKYIELMRRFDLEVAGEFLVMAATLMYIKSKELLPVEQQSQMEDDDEDEDTRWELIRQLVEYKKFKDAAADFKQLEIAQEDVFPRNPPKPDFPVQKIKGKVSVLDLLGAVNRILERIDSREEREIVADRWTVSEKIEQIHGEIQKRERFKFSELFEDALSRSEVVATFLALLELIKLKVIVVEQPDTYSDIDICKAPPGHKLNLDEEGDLPLEDAAGLSASEFDAPAGEQE
ncbi:MAG: segregation and condensation protein A [Limisphaerales bacterium]